MPKLRINREDVVDKKGNPLINPCTIERDVRQATAGVKTPVGKLEGASGVGEGVNAAGLAAGASMGFSNPGSAFQNVEMAFAQGRWTKDYVEGRALCAKKGQEGEERRKGMDQEELNTTVGNRKLVWGERGITERRGYVRYSDGSVYYAGPGKGYDHMNPPRMVQPLPLQSYWHRADEKKQNG